jgi:tetratricopeptide (TPR) repeat protein
MVGDLQLIADVEASIQKAEELARGRHWGAAAVLFAQAAGRAMKPTSSEREVSPEARATARRAWEAAGEAWRRDDRPLSAAQALGMALELTSGDGQESALARIKLAGVLGELGESETAVRLCRDAAQAVGEGPVHAVALDTWIEALQALGRKEQAKAILERLVPEGKGSLQVAVWFREGQMFRMDGELTDAALRFGLVASELEGVAEALPGLAAAEAELGEVALLRGDIPEALALYDRSVEHFGAVGRRALVWRAEAGRARANVEAGAQPLVIALDEGIALAENRQMVVLEADLRIARGVARAQADVEAARKDLDQAILLADRAKHPLRAGRARLEHARRLPGTDEDRIDMLVRAEAELKGNEPWFQRARLARASLMARGRPDEARRLALTAVARFAAMEMDVDSVGARKLVRQLS